jgi:hypothetical protein
MTDPIRVHLPTAPQIPDRLTGASTIHPQPAQSNESYLERAGVFWRKP